MERRGFLKSLFAGTSAAAFFSAGGSRAVEAKTASLNIIEMNKTVTGQIESLLRETEAIWDSQDTARLRDLWDTEDPDPYYLAGEQENWFIGWDAINAYLAPPPGSPKVTEAIRVRFRDVNARLLAPDLAFAAYWMRTEMKLIFAEKPFGSDNRVSSVFRRKPEGWRYVCYSEAFQSPTIYFQKLYEKDVAPDYQGFYDEVTGK
jgi:SnoaL-like domain